MVQLTEELVEDLDAESSRRGVSRSALIREAVTSYLENVRSSDVGRAIVNGYLDHPPHTPDEWSDLDSFGDVSALELAQRLDSEERQAGLESW